MSTAAGTRRLPLSLHYLRELDLIGPHGSSAISAGAARKDPMTTFELAKLCESVAAQSEADTYERIGAGWALRQARRGAFDDWLASRGIARSYAESLIRRLLDGGFREQA